MHACFTCNAPQLGKLTVADLKEVCAALGVAVSGAKALLVGRIEGALDKL
jgi:hypothetical protein